MSDKESKFSFAKNFIYAVISFIIVCGAYILFKKPEIFPAYREYCETIADYFLPLILMVGFGRAFKNSKWSKDQ